MRFFYRYRSTKRPLFLNNLPDDKTVIQSGIGTCWIMATLNSIIYFNPFYFERIIEETKNGYLVNLYENEIPVKIFVPKKYRTRIFSF